jgi:glutamate-5-semialdehyde dehydrogenase
MLSGADKNAALREMAETLQGQGDVVLEANTLDLERARDRGSSNWILEGMKLTPERLSRVSQQLQALADLPNPIGALDKQWRYDRHMFLARYRVPLGTIALVYETYPELAANGIGMALKSGNCVVVASGGEISATHEAMVSLLSTAVYEAGLPEGAVQSVPGDRPEPLRALLRQSRLLDLVLACGRNSWLEEVRELSTATVLAAQLGQGYIYISASATWSQVQAAILDADCPLSGRECGSAKSRRFYPIPALGLLLHEAWAEAHLPQLVDALAAQDYSLVGDERVGARLPHIPLLQDETVEEDSETLPIRIVPDTNAAIAWIKRHSFGQVETIIADSTTDIQHFALAVETSTICINSCAAFTDTAETRLGALLGISSQKLPARGPVNLEDLTTVKYILEGLRFADE